MKIREVFGLRPVMFEERFNEDYIAYFKKVIQDKEVLKLVDVYPERNLLSVLNIGAGIEIELENVVDIPEIPRNWNTVRDNSLRNSGLEFVTKIGKRLGTCIIALENLLVMKEACGFVTSDRTSMHVHLNVSDMTLNQLRNMVMLYILLERALMSYVEPLRRNNIFCVPLVDTPRLNGFACNDEQGLEQMIRHAAKYCALNLGSVREHGTIEFRQMQVPKDLHEAAVWVLLLGSMKRYASHTPTRVLQKEIADLKTMSNYEVFINKIFFGMEKFVRYTPSELDEAVTDCKLLFNIGA